MRRRTSKLGTHLVPLAALLGVAVLLGCGGRDSASVEVDHLVNKDHEVKYGDELLPFDPAEWTTNQDYPLVGDPNALRVVKDRPFVRVWETFPATLRTEGPNSNSTYLRTIKTLLFESLVQIHPETEEFIPNLASHWKIETDTENNRQTFWFHIDPKARFSDGSEVTADDVYWSWWHLTQEDRNDPMSVMTYKEDYEEPEVLDKYTVKVTTKELNWRLFLYFGVSMYIFPGKYCHIDGKTYLQEYNWRFMPGTGPYELRAGGLQKGKSLTLTRRDDWWAENERHAVGTHNFHLLKFLLVRKTEIRYQMFKKGDLDHYQVGKAQRWVEELPQEEIIQKGWVKRRKIYNEAPQGHAGFCFNMRKPPFNDKRVRLAFCHLFNREMLFEKLFFHEYEFMDSYFPGRDWGNEVNNEKIRYDPDRAAELLAEAGYKERNEEGILVGPDGKPFEIDFRYGWQSTERIWLPIVKDFKKAGIKINLVLIDPTTLQQKISQRQFVLHFQSWNAILFPNPETGWRSDLADKNDNNNMPGFKNARVDELCKQYNVTFDRQEQKKIIREIDSIIFREHPYALGWYGPFQRILYWDKFGHPKNYVTRIGVEVQRDMMLLWWFDPEREKAMLEARKNNEPVPDYDEVVVKPWAKDQ